MRRGTGLFGLLAVVAIGSAQGCQKSEPPVPPQDEVLQAQQAVALPGATWTISEAPVAAVEDESDSMATFVRVNGLTRFNDGTIAARDFMTPTIRVFSATGKFVRAIGRRGGGPGEFQSLIWYGEQGDTIVAFDQSSQRVTRFRHDGALINTGHIDGAEPREFLAGRFRNGTWILRTFGSGTTRNATGVNRDSLTITALTESSPPSRKHIGTAPGMALSGAHGDRTPFGANTDVAVSADVVWIGDNGTNVIRAVDGEGREVERIVVPWRAMPVTNSMIAQLKREDVERARMAESKKIVAQSYESGELPATTPVYNTFFVARDGNVWVEGYTLGRRGPATYLVYGEDGNPLAHVRGPAGLRLKDAGNDWVLGIHFDSDETETIHLHGLVR